MEDSNAVNLNSQFSSFIVNYFNKESEAPDQANSQRTTKLDEYQAITDVKIIINNKNQQPKIIETKKRINKTVALNNQKNQGHWTTQEHQTYVEFLEKHHTSAMQNQQNRKNNKIFKLMSQTIETRTPSQCRSHHQKFNPFTVAGQKRIKRSKKRVSTIENQTSTSFEMEIKQSYTPETKPQGEVQLFEYEEYLSNYEDGHRPQLQNFCRNSLENLDNGQNFQFLNYNHDCDQFFD